MAWVAPDVVARANLMSLMLIPRPPGGKGAGGKGASEPVVEAAEPVAAQPVADQAAGPVEKPVVEQLKEYVEQHGAEQVVEPMKQPVVDHAMEPVEQPIVEQVGEKMARPIVDQAAEPMKWPVVEQVTKQMEEHGAEQAKEVDPWYVPLDPLTPPEPSTPPDPPPTPEPPDEPPPASAAPVPQPQPEPEPVPALIAPVPETPKPPCNEPSTPELQRQEERASERDTITQNVAEPLVGRIKTACLAGTPDGLAIRAPQPEAEASVSVDQQEIWDTERKVGADGGPSWAHPPFDNEPPLDVSSSQLEPQVDANADGAPHTNELEPERSRVTPNEMEHLASILSTPLSQIDIPSDEVDDRSFAKLTGDPASVAAACLVRRKLFAVIAWLAERTSGQVKVGLVDALRQLRSAKFWLQHSNSTFPLVMQAVEKRVEDKRRRNLHNPTTPSAL